MVQANLLKGISLPHCPTGIVLHVAPEMVILTTELADELQMEQREQVYQLVHLPTAFIPECRILPQEITLAKIVKHFCKESAIIHLHCFLNVLTAHTT